MGLTFIALGLAFCVVGPMLVVWYFINEHLKEAAREIGARHDAEDTAPNYDILDYLIDDEEHWNRFINYDMRGDRTFDRLPGEVPGWW
ncbi:MAG: hypothetical protein AMJ53_01305 [Gammaproteobacteria bacterium SG8_11]|nr:MAG: hypothetical protein AMJ53_01305 [Gammaproteobacteria bacterium SG8_11]